jgi:hypothetical protein
MPEIKVQCDCGQKFKFDVEPVNGQMPFQVKCPACNVDGTAKANLLLQTLPPPRTVTPPPMPPPVPARQPALSMAAPAPMVQSAPAQRYPSAIAAQRPALAAARPQQKSSDASNSLVLGIVGAVVGAALGAGLMYGFFEMAGIRFPLMGTGIGALTGLGARILYRGTDSVLGAISGGIAAAATVGAFILMFGEFNPIYFLTVIFSIYFAYRVAA